MGKNQTEYHSKLLGLTNNKVERKYGIVSIGSWTFVNSSSVPIVSNRFSKWQAHAYHRKVWVPPPPRPRSTAFIDTLSSCLRDGTQESYLSSLLFFFFFFFFFVFCCFFFVSKCSCFISNPNLLHLEPTFGMLGAKDWHAWSFFFFFFFFFRTFVRVTFVMWTENKLFSRKGISWKQNDNLITQYEHE